MVQFIGLRARERGWIFLLVFFTHPEILKILICLGYGPVAEKNYAEKCQFYREKKTANCTKLKFSRNV